MEPEKAKGYKIHTYGRFRVKVVFLILKTLFFLLDVRELKIRVMARRPSNLKH